MANTFQSFPVSQTLTSTTKTGNYTVTINDDVILADSSGGAFTLTLPAASATGGKFYRVKKTSSSSPTLTVTIARAGADTIDGGTSYVLYTLNEELEFYSDGVSAWVVTNHFTNTDWTAYTPTGSWVSNTAYTGYWRRVGDTMEVRTRAATSGTPTTATLTINPPLSFNVDSSKFFDTSGNATIGIITVHDSGSSRIGGFIGTDGAGVMTAYVARGDATYVETTVVNASTPIAFSTGDSVFFAYSVPISGWKA